MRLRNSGIVRFGKVLGLYQDHPEDCAFSAGGAIQAEYARPGQRLCIPLRCLPMLLSLQRVESAQSLTLGLCV